MSGRLVGVSLKMYFGRHRTGQWCRAVADIARNHPAIRDADVELVVLPSFPYLSDALDAFAGTRVQVGAQNLTWSDEGAFTGEVSGKQLAELGCAYVEVGHAERRRLFGEDDATIAMKTAAAFRNGLTPIVCVGEIEQGGRADAIVDCEAQLNSSLSVAVNDACAPLVVAYEPQWAIGASEPASPDHVTAVSSALGRYLDGFPQFAGSSIIYGGSAGPGLFPELERGVDGLFLGRFAHQPEALSSILDEVSTRVATSTVAQWQGGPRT